MSLLVVARFAVYQEALIACCALESAGIPATVADAAIGTLDPLMQVALQGFRVCVPASELESAREILMAAQAAGAEAAPLDIEPATRSTSLGWMAVAAGLFAPELGLLVAGAPRNRMTVGRALAMGLPLYLVVLLILGGCILANLPRG